MTRMGIELPVGTKFLAQFTGNLEPIECQVVLHDEKKWKSCRAVLCMTFVQAGTRTPPYPLSVWPECGRISKACTLNVYQSYQNHLIGYSVHSMRIDDEIQYAFIIIGIGMLLLMLKLAGYL